MESIATKTKERQRLPVWLRRALPTTNTFAQTRGLLDELNLHTVCESAKCPNHWECWSKGTASFMIAGDRCTRACGFCAISTQKPKALDPQEPERVAEAATRMKLKHVVITAVARDDLSDGGAIHFRNTIEAIRLKDSEMIIEVLTPDFLLKENAVDSVLSAKPHIFNHNMETVRRRHMIGHWLFLTWSNKEQIIRYSQNQASCLVWGKQKRSWNKPCMICVKPIAIS